MVKRKRDLQRGKWVKYNLVGVMMLTRRILNAIKSDYSKDYNKVEDMKKIVKVTILPKN